jgi:exonuclease III
MDLRFLSWNCSSLRNKLTTEFRETILLRHKIDVAMIQETYLTSALTLSFPGYSQFRQDVQTAAKEAD